MRKAVLLSVFAVVVLGYSQHLLDWSGDQIAMFAGPDPHDVIQLSMFAGPDPHDVGIKLS